MPGVSIVGSGNVGANIAFFIAEKGTEHVTLYDIKEGLSTGKALDMMEGAPVRRYRSKLAGSDSLESIGNSDVIVLAAGAVRKPGMKREDLLAENLPLVRELAPRIARLAPTSVVILASEPVDPLTTEFARLSKLPREQVLGLGGVIDSTRLRYLIARELDVAADNVQALVVGRHSDRMIPLPGYSSVGGVPLRHLLSSAKIASLLEETREAGSEIVRLAQRSSAYYAPAAAARDVIEAVTLDLRRIFSISIVLDGEYGIHGAALSLPAVIGRQGAVKVMTPSLGAEEERLLKASAEDVKRLLAGSLA